MHKIIVVVAAWLRPWLHHLENLFSDAMRSCGEYAMFRLNSSTTDITSRDQGRITDGRTDGRYTSKHVASGLESSMAGGKTSGLRNNNFCRRLDRKIRFNFISFHLFADAIIFHHSFDSYSSRPEKNLTCSTDSLHRILLILCPYYRPFDFFRFCFYNFFF